MNRFLGLLLLLVPPAFAGPYTADTSIAHDDDRFVGWADSVVSLHRGPVDIRDPGGATASYGQASDALGAPDVSLAGGGEFPVVSLGDGGSITLGFSTPITNGAGADFAVFENGFSYLEFAFVEVSSDGTNFFRFDSDYAPTGTPTQTSGFGTSDPGEFHNLAGKYPALFGTPFDLQELAGEPGLDLTAVTQVRIVDVVGSLDPLYGTEDADGDLINDPFPTNWDSGGFDLDAVGVLNAVPEPSGVGLLLVGLLLIARWRTS